MTAYMKKSFMVCPGTKQYCANYEANFGRLKYFTNGRMVFTARVPEQADAAYWNLCSNRLWAYCPQKWSLWQLDGKEPDQSLDVGVLVEELI